MNKREEQSKSDFFNPGSIEHQLQPKGGRDLSTYEKQLLFDREDLRGKVILDLGAGPDLKFAKGLKESGIEADVISLSPDFKEEKYLKKAQESLPGARLVAGTGQELPFADESFDRVFVFHVDEHVNRDVFFKIIDEIARVLKKEGQGKYGPVLNIPGEWNPYRAILDNKELIEKFKKEGVTIVDEPIPEAIMPKARIKDSYANVFYEPSYNIIIKSLKNR